MVDPIAKSQIMETLQILYGKEFAGFVSRCRLLVVGVGGIGCQVLKNLACLPPRHLDVIDMDTIETSNLNRQFLFRPEHKGLFKAKVAAEAMALLAPHVRVTPHTCSVYDMPLAFFRQFDAVVLALDNIEARTYVNNICVRLGKPVLDAGTAGFQGQVYLVDRGLSRCYSCEKKETNTKVYPSCTIRNRPTKDVHCVVWAKHLFDIFFKAEQESLLVDLGHLTEQSPDVVFDALFFQDVNRHNSPEVRQRENIKALLYTDLPGTQLHFEDTLQEAYMSSCHPAADYKLIFQESFLRLREDRRSGGPLEFEKDDDLKLSFIVGAAVLRMFVFGIAPITHFQVKEMVGNIIPAISSTNSIVASVQMSELLKYLFNKLASKRGGGLSMRPLKQLYVQNTLSKKIIANRQQKPNPLCTVCALDVQPVTMLADFKLTTLGQVLALVKEESGLTQLSVSSGSLLLITVDEYMDEEEERDNRAKEARFLAEFFNQNFVLLSIYDEAEQRLACYLLLSNQPYSSPQLFNSKAFRERPASRAVAPPTEPETQPVTLTGNTIVLDEPEDKSGGDMIMLDVEPGPLAEGQGRLRPPSDDVAMLPEEQMIRIE